MSALSSSVVARLALALLLILNLSSTLALPIDPKSTITLSFLNGNNDLIPGPNATIEAHASSCIQIPTLASSFRSNSNQTVFAIYQDLNCQAYLYSVGMTLANVHGAQSLAWVDEDPAQTHAPGETFTDPLLTPDGNGKDVKSRLVLIVIISVSTVLFLIALGVYLCYMDNKRNLKRGGYVPEPLSPTGHRNMAEIPPGQSDYKHDDHHRNASSVSSSVTYLPPYASEGGYKTAVAGSDSMTPPEETLVATSPSQKRALPAARYELPARKGSVSKLTNKVGTGAGLEPGAVQQGRNAGFGLGYDIEESRRHLRNDSDIILRDAVTTPPHSPFMRPSSVVSDDNGMVTGRAGVRVSQITDVIAMLGKRTNGACTGLAKCKNHTYTLARCNAS